MLSPDLHELPADYEELEVHSGQGGSSSSSASSGSNSDSQADDEGEGLSSAGCENMGGILRGLALKGNNVV